MPPSLATRLSWGEGVKRFCPKCGTGKGPFVKGFCKNCFLEKFPIVDLPEKIGIEFCKRCGKVRHRGKWEEQGEAVMEDIALSKLKAPDLQNPETEVSLKPNEDGTTLATIKIKAKYRGEEIELEKEALLKPVSGICDACMKISSNYHEAILQLRQEKTPSRKEADVLIAETKKALEGLRRGDDLARIVGTVTVPKGIDIMLGSKRAGKIVAQYFAQKDNSEIKRSHKLTGIDKSGKEKRRYSFCVRVSPRTS